MRKKDYIGLPNTNRLKKKKPDLSEVELENYALNKRIKELEKLLGEEKIRSEMYSRVIEIAKNAIRTVGQAVGVGHMKEHAMVCSDNAIKTVQLAFPNTKEKIIAERKWQLKALEEVRASTQ